MATVKAELENGLKDLGFRFKNLRFFIVCEILYKSYLISHYNHDL